MTFKNQLINDFIPAIENMLLKERIHLVHLLHMKQKLEKRCYNAYISDIGQMIGKSKSMVIHFEKRLIEYKDYANKI